MAKLHSADETYTQQIKALAYARVSTKEQEKEGFSIPAQLELLQSYAAERNIKIAAQFTDNETAKEAGRTNFLAMLRYLKEHHDVSAILVEKTDRLYRNLRDWVTIDDLSVEVHLVKEGVILSENSRSSEKFVHGIKVLMAKNYVDNLSEETRKGMTAKAKAGFYPSCAPCGYRNVVGADGKRTIDIDPDVGPVISKMFAWYATGTVSLKALCELAHEAGLAAKDGRPINQSTAQMILKKRTYTGDFEWAGEFYRGNFPPLISREIFERVQGVLAARDNRKPKNGKLEFAFSGVVFCGHCGCSLVGELKKKKYIYYHCTGHRGKCPEPYVREEVIEGQFIEALDRLRLGDTVIKWLTQALRDSHETESRDHEAAVAHLRGEYEKLQSRINAAYVDKLDGLLAKGEFQQVTKSFREQQDGLLDRIKYHQRADRSYMEFGERLLDVADRAGSMFKTRDGLQKRELLKFVCSNSTWKNGKLTTQWRQPFDMIAETAAVAADVAARKGAESALGLVWLPRLGSNQRPFD